MRFQWHEENLTVWTNRIFVISLKLDHIVLDALQMKLMFTWKFRLLFVGRMSFITQRTNISNSFSCHHFSLREHWLSFIQFFDYCVVVNGCLFDGCLDLKLWNRWISILSFLNLLSSLFWTEVCRRVARVWIIGCEIRVLNNWFLVTHILFFHRLILDGSTRLFWHS